MPGETEAMAFTDSYNHMECLGGMRLQSFLINVHFVTSSLFSKNGGRYCFGVRRRIRRLRGCFALYLGCFSSSHGPC